VSSVHVWTDLMSVKFEASGCEGGRALDLDSRRE
jgi:hypothetical protein